MVEPQWPVEPERLAAQTKALDALLSLPKPGRGSSAQQYHRQVIDVLERKSSHSLVALIDRAAWELRPEDELIAVLAPDSGWHCGADLFGAPLTSRSC